MTALQRIIEPTLEPLTLAEVKEHLRVDHDDEDNVIAIYIRAAREFLEGPLGFLGRALVTQSWRLTLDSFPTTITDAAIRIPLPPLQSITQIAYDDSAGVEQIIDAADYYVDNQSEPGWVVPSGSLAWPTPIDAINSVRVDFVCGYLGTSNDSPSVVLANIPFNIKAGMLLMIGNMYENREDNVVGVISTRLPNGAEYLLRRHKFDLSMA